MRKLDKAIKRFMDGYKKRVGDTDINFSFLKRKLDQGEWEIDHVRDPYVYIRYGPRKNSKLKEFYVKNLPKDFGK